MPNLRMNPSMRSYTCVTARPAMRAHGTTERDLLRHLEECREHLFTINQSRLNALSELQAAKTRISVLGQSLSVSSRKTRSLQSRIPPAPASAHLAFESHLTTPSCPFQTYEFLNEQMYRFSQHLLSYRETSGAIGHCHKDIGRSQNSAYPGTSRD